MAKGISGRELNYSVKLDLTQVKKDKEAFLKMLSEIKSSSDKAFDPNASKGYAEAQKTIRLAITNSQLETQKLRQENAKLRNDYDQGKITAQQYRTEISRINLERRKEVEAARAARIAVVAVAGSYAEAQQRLKALGAEIRNTAGGFNGTTPALKAQIKEYNALNDGLKKFDASMGNHQRNVGDYRSAIKGAASDLLGFATQYLSLGAALTFVFDKTLAFQRIKTPLSFILGSEGEANNKLAELRQLADQLGVSYFTLANSYKSFTAAARASNFDLAQSEKIFKSVTKASAVLGLSSEQLEGALLAIQQMISKGNVQAEELRGQLAERLPGAFALAAKAMGVTESELNNLLKTGQVLAADLLPKLADQLDKAYGDKATEGVKGLNSELGRLKAALESAAGDNSGLSSKVFEPIIIGAREAVKEIGQMFRGSFTENLSYFLTFSNKGLADKRQVYDLRDAKNNNLSAQTAAEQYSTEGKSLADLKTKYDQLTTTMRSAVAAQSLFKMGVKKGTLEETKDATVVQYTSIANGIIAQRSRIAMAIKTAKQNEVKGNKEVLDGQLNSITEIRKRITDLQKVTGSAIEGSDVNKRILALQDRLKKPSITGVKSEESKLKAAISAAESYSQKLTDLHNASFRKTLSSDDAEVQAVKDKYAKFGEETEAFYKKYGGKQSTAKINGKNVSKSEVIGTLKADQKNELDAIAEKRAKEANDKQAKIEKDYYDKLVSDFAGYADRKKQIETDLAKDLILLGDDTEAQANRQKKADEELKRLNDENGTKLKSYEDLFIGIETLSTKSALRTVQKARGLLAEEIKKGLLTPEEIRQINDLLNKSELDIRNKSGQSLIDLASQIQGAASAVSGLNEEFGKVLSTVGDVVGQVGNIKKGFADFKSSGAKGDTLGQLGAGLGIFGAGISIFQTVFKLFDKSAQLNANFQEQQRYNSELQLKQNDSLTKALERQVALLDNVYGTQRITNYNNAIKQANADQEKYLADIKNKYQLTGDSVADKTITIINNGAYDAFGFNALYLETLKKSGLVKGITDTSTENLQKLIDTGKLDANTLSIVQNLIKARETALQLVNALNAETVGSTLAQIADDFINTLTDGTQDFGKTFTDTIQKSILNGFKGELIRKQLQAFYEQFATLSEGGLTKDEIETLRLSYISASEKAKKDIEDLSAATGIDLNSGKASSSAASSTGIARANLTEETGQRIDGIMRAQYEATKESNIILAPIGRTISELYQIASNNFDVQIKIEQNTLRTANNTERLQAIEKGIDTIAANTKQAVTPRGAGI